MDRCQSQDGAEAALQELERYLDTAPLHTLVDRNAVCCQYESTLTAQLRVSQERIQLTNAAWEGLLESVWRLNNPVSQSGPGGECLPEAGLGPGDVR